MNAIHLFQPFLKLILNVANTCSTKFNVSSLTIAMNKVDSSGRPSIADTSLGICYVNCMLTELDIVRSSIVFQFSEFCITVWTAFCFCKKVNETGINEPWAGTYEERIVREPKHKAVMAVFNDGISLIHSKCSAESNELPDMKAVLREIRSKADEIFMS